MLDAGVVTTFAIAEEEIVPLRKSVEAKKGKGVPERRPFARKNKQSLFLSLNQTLIRLLINQ
jgi:hypothetical protein